MDISSALNRIEVVLNQYRAFQEIEEALKAAVSAEQIVVDLGLKAEALRRAIVDLEAANEKAVGDAAAVQVEYNRVAAEAEGKLRKVAEEWDAKIAAANAEYDRMLVITADAKAKFEVEAEERRRQIDALQYDADAEEARFKTAKHAIDSLKAVL